MHQHQGCDVHDFRVESVVSQMLLDREPADRIHLIDRSDVDAVAVAQVREQHVVAFTEVIDARSVQQKEVRAKTRGHLLIHDGRIPYLIDRARSWEASAAIPGASGTKTPRPLMT